jgi:hypothetical protein
MNAHGRFQRRVQLLDQGVYIKDIFSLPPDPGPILEIGKALRAAVTSGSVEACKTCTFRKVSSGQLTAKLFEGFALPA